MAHRLLEGSRTCRDRYRLGRRFFLKTTCRPKKKSLGRRTTNLPAKKKIDAVVIIVADWSRGMILASGAEHLWFESE
jgi:hypothetical protein